MKNLNNMEVFDKLTKTVVFKGSKEECRKYIEDNDHGFLTIKIY